MRILLLVTIEVGAVVAGHRLAQVPWLRVRWGDPAAWLDATPPGDALAALLRVGATALAWWVLATTLLHLGARLVGTPRATRATAALLAPAARRVIAGALVGATLNGPAYADIAPPVPAHAVEEPAEHAPVAPLADDPVAEDGPERVHVVTAGESLWSIASEVTAGRDVAEYWLRLVAANRPRLRSGDADVIFPGERLTLPPLHLR